MRKEEILLHFSFLSLQPTSVHEFVLISSCVCVLHSNHAEGCEHVIWEGVIARCTVGISVLDFAAIDGKGA